jgi:hypothetical protein
VVRAPPYQTRDVDGWDAAGYLSECDGGFQAPVPAKPMSAEHALLAFVVLQSLLCRLPGIPGSPDVPANRRHHGDDRPGSPPGAHSIALVARSE